VICCTNHRRGKDTVSCGQRGGREVIRALRKAIKARGIDVSVVASGCLGSCNSGPNIRIAPSSSWMSGARVEDLALILDAIERTVTEQRAAEGGDEHRCRDLNHVPSGFDQ
ncbi:MAG: (2Fe-2S) ferredoxin domain-containing protein, partial [Proteobacteria bacterium]|nr:(2Fe-2S) ferredoxin domain-containing protein [Pseudomonadota bacterium]